MSDDDPRVTPRHGVPVPVDQREVYLSNKASAFATLASQLHQGCVILHTLSGDKLRAYLYDLATKVQEVTDQGHELRRWLRDIARETSSP